MLRCMSMWQAQDSDQRTVAGVSQSFAAAQPVSVELLLCTKGNVLLWSQISFTPVFSEAGDAVDNYVRSVPSILFQQLALYLPCSILLETSI